MFENSWNMFIQCTYVDRLIFIGSIGTILSFRKELCECIYWIKNIHTQTTLQDKGIVSYLPWSCSCLKRARFTKEKTPKFNYRANHKRLVVFTLSLHSEKFEQRWKEHYWCIVKKTLIKCLWKNHISLMKCNVISFKLIIDHLKELMFYQDNL